MYVLLTLMTSSKWFDLRASLPDSFTALCSYPHVKVSIRDLSQTLPPSPFSRSLIISDRNIWRLPAGQFHF